MTERRSEAARAAIGVAFIVEASCEPPPTLGRFPAVALAAQVPPDGRTVEQLIDAAPGPGQVVVAAGPLAALCDAAAPFAHDGLDHRKVPATGRCLACDLFWPCPTDALAAALAEVLAAFPSEEAT